MARAEAFDTSKPLIGTDEATVDDKGRLSFTFRKAHRLGEELVVVLGKLNCLVVYPAVVWAQVAEEALSLPVMHPAREHFTRLVMPGAVDEISFDQQNRIVVPQDLRDALGLRKGDKVKILGCGDRVEVWPEAEWDKYAARVARFLPDREEAVDKAYAPIAEHVLATRSNDEREATAKESGA